MELDEFLPAPPKEAEVSLPEIKMPEAPHKPLTGAPVEDVNENHIPLAPLSAPDADKKEALSAPPKFPD